MKKKDNITAHNCSSNHTKNRKIR